MPRTAARQSCRNVASSLFDGRRFARAFAFGQARPTPLSYTGMVRPCFCRALIGLAVFLLLLAAAGQAHARRGGIAASSCEGCHGDPGTGQLTLTASPATF